MVVQISIRKSIRWLPDPPSEPTSTLVIDVGTYFIDLRILTSPSSSSPSSQIDWAMAGTRTVLSTFPLKCRWHKIICSHDTEAHDDVGEFEDLPDGDSLETGRMEDAEGVLRDYEEVWGELEVRGGQVNWIVGREDGDGVIFLGRVGDRYQGMRKRKRDGGFDVLREVCEEGKWVARFSEGENLISMRELAEDGIDVGMWKEGEEVVLRGIKFEVYAVEKS